MSLLMSPSLDIPPTRLRILDALYDVSGCLRDVISDYFTFSLKVLSYIYSPRGSPDVKTRGIVQSVQYSGEDRCSCSGRAQYHKQEG